MKKWIIIGIIFFTAVAIIAGITVFVLTNNKEQGASAPAYETAIEQTNQIVKNEPITIMIDNPPSMGGENQEISLDELERREEEKQKEQLEEKKIEEEQTEQEEENAEQENHQQQYEENHTETIEYPTGDSPYYIKVNNQANVVTIYGKDDNGYYSVPIRAMICSTGEVTPPSWRYPSNKYDIQDRWEWLGLFGDVYGHYATQITGNILFHSVPYTEKWNPASLEYWEYDKLRNIMFYGLCKINYRRCMVDFLLCA